MPGGAPELAWHGKVGRGIEATLDELAGKLSINANGLKTGVQHFNAAAAAAAAAGVGVGVDPAFRRGETAYQRHLGGPAWRGPHPTLGPLLRVPFHAVRLCPGNMRAATGLVTDTLARVLDVTGAPIEGLYAVGNDLHSTMGGVYTAPGITLGPGLVFAYLAAQHAAARAAAPSRKSS